MSQGIPEQPVFTAHVMHLQRFHHNKAKQRLKKIENYVSFPLDELDMQPFLSTVISNQGPRQSEDDYLYDLSAVVEHHGDSTCQSGHYTAYVRHKWNPQGATPPSCQQDPEEHYSGWTPPKPDPRSTDEWYLFDDSCVYHATPEDVSRCHAYLLFYVRKQLAYSPF